MLAIIRALKKWHTDLIGVPFLIYTDHKTLQNFDTQRDLSRRQARWMEFLSQYDGKIVYVKGEENTVADALSRLPASYSANSSEANVAAQAPYDATGASILEDCDHEPLKMVASLIQAPLEASSINNEINKKSNRIVTQISADAALLSQIREGYETDPWIKSLEKAAPGMAVITKRSNLWFIGNRLVIPKVSQLRETIFRLAHDVLGHFGPDKSYATIRDAFYWPNMRRDLQEAYVLGCTDCQRNKSTTIRPVGPLHPLPVPDERGASVAMDFVGPLPPDDGFDYILTITDRLGSDIQIIPTVSDLSAEKLAELFFNHWYCENGLPREVISDRDKLFTSLFWKALHKLTGVKLKMSTAYHPETDGSSERSNKTIIQALRYHVERNQKGWVKALPRIRFAIMNTVNKSTNFTPFQLKYGRSPRVIPPLIEGTTPTGTAVPTRSAQSVINQLEVDVMEAQDNLLRAKVAQAVQANKSRTLTFPYAIGQRVRLSTRNRRQEYKAKGEKRVAKFMPRFSGPYKIIGVDEEHSTVTLDLPNSANFYPVFHTSQLIPFVENDDELFPARALHKPKPVEIDGVEEHFVDHIVAARPRGCGWQYLVRWQGEGPEGDEWLPGRELNNCEALNNWLAKHPTDGIFKR